MCVSFDDILKFCGAIIAVGGFAHGIPWHKKRLWHNEHNEIYASILSSIRTEKLADIVTYLNSSLNDGSEYQADNSLSILRQVEDDYIRLLQKFENHVTKNFPGKSKYLDEYVKSSRYIFKSFDECLSDLRSVVKICQKGDIAFFHFCISNKNSNKLQNLVTSICAVEKDILKAKRDIIKVMYEFDGISDYGEKYKAAYEAFIRKDKDSSKISIIQLKIEGFFNSAEALQKLGNIYKEQGDFNEAIKWFRKASSLGNGEASYNCGIILGGAEKGEFLKLAIEQGYHQAALCLIYHYAYSGAISLSKEALQKYQDLIEPAAISDARATLNVLDYLNGNLGKMGENSLLLSNLIDFSYMPGLNSLSTLNLKLSLNSNSTEELVNIKSHLSHLLNECESYSEKAHYFNVKTRIPIILHLLFTVNFLLCNDEIAYYWALKFASEFNDSGLAAYNIAFINDHRYKDDSFCIPKSYFWYKKADENGYRYAKIGLALCHLNSGNVIEAERLLQEAMRYNIPDAYYYYYKLLEKTESLSETDYDLLIRAKDLKYPPAIVEYVRKNEAELILSNPDKIKSLYLTAAYMGNHDAIEWCDSNNIKIPLYARNIRAYNYDYMQNLYDDTYGNEEQKYNDRIEREIQIIFM